MDLKTLKNIEAAASPAPWKPNCVHETEGEGAWGAGPLCEPSTPEDIERCENGDWDQEAQESLADEDAALIADLRNLAPEIIALWQAVNLLCYPPADCPATCLTQFQVVRENLDWLNSKLADIA